MNIDNADAGGSAVGDNVAIQAVARPRNVLNAVSEVAEQLRTILQPAQSSDNGYRADSLHLLSVNVNTQSIQLPLQAIQISLKSFEANVLNNTIADNASLSGVELATQLLDPASNVVTAGPSQLSQNDRLRLLSLLRESASLQLSENATHDTAKTARDVLKRRSHWSHVYPVLPAVNIASTLENLAKQCGLHVFASQDDDLGDGMIGIETELEDKPTKQTITIAGTGIVVDIDIDAEQVSAVRFAYGSDAHNDPGIEHLLLRLAQKQEWQRLRDSLAYLAALDAFSKQMHDDQSQGQTITQGAVQVADAFFMIQNISQDADKSYKAELETVSSPSELFHTGNGICLSNHGFPYATLIYSVSAVTLFSTEWDAVIQSGFQASEVDALLSLPDTMCARLHVASDSRSDSLQLECRLDSPVTISAAAGHTLCQALTVDRPQDPAMAMLYSLSTANAAASLQQHQRESIEAIILPQIQPGIAYQMHRKDVNTAWDDSRPLRVHLLRPSTFVPSFAVKSLRFTSLVQLHAALRILRSQSIAQELLTSVFEGISASSIVDSLKEEQEVRLEDLLSDKAVDYAALAVRHECSTFPSITYFVYRLSGFPAWQPVSLHVSVTVSVEKGIELSAFKVECADADIQQRIERGLTENDGHDRASRLLRTTRSVMTLLAWLERRTRIE